MEKLNLKNNSTDLNKASTETEPDGYGIACIGIGLLCVGWGLVCLPAGLGC